jgi:AhpD family alkylhydroperoxidase
MASEEMPDSSDRLLEKVAGLFGGSAPNVYRMLAKNPAALQSFMEMEHALETEGQLSTGEQAVVALEVSVQTGCEYCESVFVGEARRHGVSEAAIKAVCAGGTPETERERLLVQATRRIAQTHGRLGRHEIAEFEERGVNAATLLEIITIFSAYTLATYTNNLLRTRIDPEFRLPPDDVCGKN